MRRSATFGLALLLTLSWAGTLRGQSDNVRTLEDRRHVTIMELAGIYDHQPEATKPQEIALRQAVAREFFRTHADDYDFLVVFTRFPFNLGADAEGLQVGGRYYAIKNDIAGIGQELFDQAAEFGSAGRLQGFIDMGSLSRIVTDPSDPNFEHTLSTLAHEFAHRWGAHVRFRDADGSPSDALLGRDAAHWSFLADTAGSVLYGNSWHDNGDGTFTAAPRSRTFYSPLDLYLMGLLDAADVPPFTLIDNAAIDANRLPEAGARITGTPRPITIDDVIAAEGPRVPAAAEAPRRFKVGFIFLVRPGEQASDLELTRINTIRDAFSTRQTILTNGAAIVDVYPEPQADPAPAPTPIVPAPAGPRTAPVNLVEAVDWLLARQRADGAWGDSRATEVRDTAAVIDLLGGVPAAALSASRGLSWLAMLQDRASVDMVARRLHAIAPQPSALDTAFLLQAKNADGGWGLRAGDRSNPLDAALALGALTGAPAAPTLAFLVGAQNADGGWPAAPGQASAIVPTVAVLAFAPVHADAAFGVAIDRARGWLAAQQRPDGGFGSPAGTTYETALALLALAGTDYPQAGVARAVDFLNTRQSADGSWQGSVYETALAVRALKVGQLPNLAVTPPIVITPQSPLEGVATTIAARIVNDSMTDAGAVLVRAFDGDPAGARQVGADVVLPAVPALSELAVEFAWDTAAAAGAHRLHVVVDPLDQIVESHESDNTTTADVTVRAPSTDAELSVTAAAIVFDPPALQRLPQSETVNAEIRNTGLAAATGVVVGLYDGDPAAGGVAVGTTIIDVPARSAALATWTFTIAASGERPYFVVIDPANAFAEEDEGNNAAFRLLPVQSRIDLLPEPGTLIFSENPIALGRDLVITATVRNAGTVDAFGVRARIYIDEPAGAIDVATITLDVPAGQARPVSATWRTSRPLSGVPVRIVVDPANAIAETNETNNEASAPLDVPASTEANLRVSHDELHVPAPVLQGGSTTVSVTVRNTGLAGGTNIVVALFNGLPETGGTAVGPPQTIPSLAAGAHAVVEIPWSPIVSPGAALIVAVVDPANTVAEFDEQDNRAFVEVDVLSLPDLVVGPASIAFSPPFPRDGDAVTVTATVINAGGQPAQNVVVRFFVGDPAGGGTPVGGDHVLPVVPAVGHGAASITIDAAIGVQPIFVIVDPGNTVAESDEANNTASRTLGVQDASLFVSHPYFSPNGDEAQDSTELFFRVDGALVATVAVVNADGEIVRRLTVEPPSASSQVHWDGLDTESRVVRDGEYRFSLRSADDTELAATPVVVDTNTLPMTAAIGTEFLIRENLTCEAPVEAVGSPVMSTAGWLPDDSAMVRVVALQSFCDSALRFGPWLCGFRIAKTPAGVYIVTPEGESRRITPDSWTVQGPADAGTNLFLIGPVHISPDGQRLLVGRQRYGWGFRTCGFVGQFQCGRILPFGALEMWALNTDGSGLTLAASIEEGENAFVNVAWSPAGDRFALFAGNPNNSSYGRLFIGFADGRPPVEAMGPDADVRPFAVEWSPGGDHLLVATQPDVVSLETPYRLYRVAPDGTERRLLSRISEYQPQLLNLWIDAHTTLLEIRGTPDGNNFFAGADPGLWRIDARGAPPQFVTDTTNRHWSAVVLSPDRSRVAFIRHSNDAPQSVWVAEAGGGARQVFSPASTQHSLGLSDVAWLSPTTIAFEDQVVTDYRICTDEGSHFCGTVYRAIRTIDISDGGEELFRVSDASLPWQSSYQPIGFHPDGRVFVFSSDGKIKAVDLTNGSVSELLDEEGTSSLQFTPAGKYLWFNSIFDLYDSTRPCWRGTSSSAYYDDIVLASLLNLRAEFTFQREGGQVVFRGTVADQTLRQYWFEFAPLATPDAWSLVAPPSESNVVGGELGRWIPPSDGTFLVRLVAEDKAGNRVTSRKRLTWGLAPSITNVVLQPRLFSPNGDGSRDTLTVDYVVLGPVNLQFSIFDAADRLVRTIAQSHAAIGPASIAWDGRNDQGQFVADGVYRIHVLDYDFFVTTDTAPPTARLASGGALHVASGVSHCALVNTQRVCGALAGERVLAPFHELAGAAMDVNLAGWVLETGVGTNPLQWTIVDQDTSAIVPANGADKLIRRLEDAREIVGRRFRLTVTDQAGNRSVALTSAVPAELILFAFDDVPVPTTLVHDHSLGVHAVSFVQTFEQPLQTLRLQYRLAAAPAWSDGPAVSLPPIRGSIPWDNSGLVGGRVYEIRLLATLISGAPIASNTTRIRADRFELTNIEGDRTFGVASLSERLATITLVIARAGDPELARTPVYSSEVDFSMRVQCLEDADILPVRYKGIGVSGAIYYSNTKSMNVGCPRPSEPTAPGGAGLTLTANPRPALACGTAAPGIVDILLTGSGVVAGSERLFVQHIPNGPLVEAAAGPLPMALALSTGARVEGTYTVRATAEPTGPGGTIAVTTTFVVDRTPPAALLTYPLSNQEFCPLRQGNELTLAVEGIAEDANFARREVEYGIGDAPAQWLPIFPLSPAEQMASKTPTRGVLANWIVTQMAGGVYTVRTKTYDQAGNLACHAATFTLASPVRVEGLRASPALFSPNGDGTLDSVLTTYNIDRRAIVTARVHAIGADGVRAPTAIRTIFAAQQEAGENAFTWDGLTDGAAPVADGRYAIVVSPSDACGNVVESFTVVEVDRTPPEASIVSPQSGQDVGVHVSVRGTAGDLHFRRYRLEIGAGEDPLEWMLIQNGTSAVPLGVLGTWGSAGRSGTQTLRLTAEDTVGNQRVTLLSVNVATVAPLISELQLSPDVLSPNGDGRFEVASLQFVLDADARVTIDVLGAGQAPVRNLATDLPRSAGTHSVEWDGRISDGSRATDGDFIIRLRAVAAADASRIQTEDAALLVDSTPPVITVEAPATDGFAGGDIGVTGSIADPLLESYQVEYAAASGGAAVTLDQGAQARALHQFGTIAGLADGAYRVSITAADRAGNRSNTTVPFTVDNTAPTATLIAPAAGAILGGATPAVPVLGAVADTNLRDWVLRVGSGSNPSQLTTIASGTSAPAAEPLLQWSVGALTDGPWTLSLLATDRAGTQTDARVTVIIDNTPPVAALAAPAAGSTLGTTTPIAGHATDTNFARAQLELATAADVPLRFAPLAELTAPVSGGALHQWPGLPADGSYVLRLTVEDAVGLRATATSQFTVDATPPQAPASLVATLEEQRNARLIWAMPADPSIVGYHVYRGGTRVTTTPVAGPPFVDVALAHGTHRYVVRAIDAGGLVSDASNEASVAVDLTAPTTRLSAPFNDARVSDLVRITGTASSPDDFREYRLSVAPQSGPSVLLRRSPAPVVAGVLGEWDTSLLPSGSTWTITLESEDLSGNTATDSRSVTIDNQAPQPPTLVSAVPAESRVDVAWQANPEPDLAGYLLYDNALVANADQLITGSVTPFLLSATGFVDLALPDGRHRYTVHAVDRAGNISNPSNAIEVTIETTAPRATIVQPGNGTRVDSITLLRANVDALDVATVQFQFRPQADPVWRNIGVATAAPFEARWDPAGLARGTYVFRAVATDLGGRTDPAPPVMTLVLTDLTAPAAPVNLVARVSGSTVRLTWTTVDTDVLSYDIFRRLGTGTPIFVNRISVAEYDDFNVADGAYTYFVEALDNDGNRGASSAPVPAVVYAPVLADAPACPAAPLVDLAGAAAAPGATVTLFAIVAGVPTATAVASAGADGTFQFTGVALTAGLNTFTVQAADAAGNTSRFSAPIEITFSPELGPVADLVATTQNGEVTLSWTLVDGAVAYNVYRGGALVSGEIQAHGTVSASSSLEEQTAAQFAADDDENTYWQPSSPESAWWRTDFASPVWLWGVEFEWVDGFVPRSFQVQYWNGSGWVRMPRFADESAESGYTRLSTPVSTSAIRILLGPDWSEVRLADAWIEVAGPTPDPTHVDYPAPGPHTYVVRPVNACGIEGAAAAVVIDADEAPRPAPPTGLAATVSGSDVSLTWDSHPDPDVYGYVLYRQLPEGDWVGVTGETIEQPSYLDAGLLNGLHRYQVTALGSWSESLPSAAVAVTVAASVPSAPILTVTAPSSGGVLDVAWLPAAGEPSAGYRLYRSGTAGGPYSVVAPNVSATLYSDRNVLNGTAYFYVVRAFDALGNESAASNEAGATPADLLAPPAPVLALPTRAGSPITVANAVTTVAGRAEPAATVTVLRDGLPLGSAEATPETLIETFEADYDDASGSIVFHPAARLVAVFAEPDGSSDDVLAVTSLDTRTTRFYNSARNGIDVKFTDDGTRVVYTSNENGPLLMRLRLDDGDHDALVFLPYEPDQLAVEPGGARAAVVINDPNGGPSQLWIATFDSGETSQLTFEDDWVYDPVWSPSGTHLAYAAGSVLKILRLSDGVAVQVSDQYEGDAVFSPDGAWLGYEAVVEDNSRVQAFNVATGAIATAPAPAAASQEEPQFARDSTLAYIEEIEDRDGAEVMTWHPSSGEAESAALLSDGDVVPFWAEDGSFVVVEDDQRFHLLRPAGRFQVDGVPLEPGVNVLTAVATDAAGNMSDPAAPTTVTRSSGMLSDLVIETADLALQPVLPAPGEPVRVAAVVRNTGTVDAADVTVAFIEIDASGAATPAGPERALGLVAAGASAAIAFDWIPSGAGVRVLRARVDPLGIIAETSETNNAASAAITVVPHGEPFVRVAVERQRYAPGETVRVHADATNAGTAADFTVTIAIEDLSGNLAATLLQTELPSFPHATRGFDAAWPAAGALAGQYRARATFTRAGGVAATAVVPFDVLPLAQAAVSLTSDRATYNVADVARIVARVRNTSPNVDLTDASARVVLRSDGGTTVLDTTAPLGTILMGGQAEAVITWPATDPGVYTATVTAAHDGGILGQASRAVTVTGVSRVSGSVTAPVTGVALGQTVRLDARVANSGTAALTGVPLRLRLIDPIMGEPISTVEHVVDLPIGADVPWVVSLESAGLRVQSYSAILEAELPAGGVTSLAAATVSIVDATAPVVQIVAPANGFVATADVTISARVSDNASPVSRVEISLDGGPWLPMAIGNAAAALYTHLVLVTPQQAGPKHASIRAFDAAGNGDTTAIDDANPASVSFTIESVNRAPMANDASRETAEDTALALALQASDPDGDELTYTVTPPLHGTLQGQAPQLTYVPEHDFHGTDQFTYTVSDGEATAQATVTILVTSVNDSPVANAGASQSVTEGAHVVLDGTASVDPESDTLVYRWRQTGGVPAVLDLTVPALPTFTAPEVPREGDALTFELVVNDGAADSAAVFALVTVNNVNRKPVIVDAAVTTLEDTPLAIDLEASDPDLDTLTWELGAAQHGTLSGSAPAMTYTPAAHFHGLDSFTVTVRDAEGLSSTATVAITITPVNDVPVAHTGPDQTVAEGTTVTLDGSGSDDADADALTFAWSQVSGPPVTLAGAETAQPTFIVPEGPREGFTMTFALTVADADATSAAAIVNITVTNVNRAPVADAGADLRVGPDVAVTLDGTASYDPDNDALTFSWTQVGGPAVNLTGTDTARLAFVAPIVGTATALTFELTVSDGLASATDRIVVDVNPVNRPAANAGPDQMVDEGATVTLDGSGSSDADGDPLTFNWSQVAGTPVVLSDVFAARPSFAAPEVVAAGSNLVFELIVNDGRLDSTPDRVAIQIRDAGGSPICTAAAAPNSLWPPNHKMVAVQITGGANNLSYAITKVTQDEPIDGTGDGDTAPDAAFEGATVLLRAERSGNGNGRVYVISYTATDTAGRTCTGTAPVEVRHDAKTPAVDDGQQFTATGTVVVAKKK